MGSNVRNKIGAVSRALGLSVKTIRYYESVGLVEAPQRTAGSWHSIGQRIYVRISANVTGDFGIVTGCV